MSAVLKRHGIRALATQRKADKLDYVRQMLRELREMMEAEDEQFIAYLICMAYGATSDLIRQRYANLISDNPQAEGAGNDPASFSRRSSR